MDNALEAKLRHLVEVFLAENAVTNLSGHKTPEACWDGNVRDSLPLLDILKELKTPPSKLRAILDVGSGGGFPALPLAIAMPAATVMALDSTGKKLDAVARMAKKLDLTNVKIANGRAEALGRNPDMREAFDIVTARAVAALPVLLEYCSPFARNNGWIVLWKSLDVAEELKASERAQRELRCTLWLQHEYDLGGTWGKRQLLVFKKEGVLSPKYPRGVGEPGKTPL